MAETSQEIVNKFLAARPRLSLDDLMGFSPRTEYQNIPVGPAVKGKDGIRKLINSVLPMVKGLADQASRPCRVRAGVTEPVPACPRECAKSA